LCSTLRFAYTSGFRSVASCARTAIERCTRRRVQRDVAVSATVTDGPFFEDFTAGATFRSAIGRTITQADNIQFSLLTNNSNEIQDRKSTRLNSSHQII